MGLKDSSSTLYEFLKKMFAAQIQNRFSYRKQLALITLLKHINASEAVNSQTINFNTKML